MRAVRPISSLIIVLGTLFVPLRAQEAPADAANPATPAPPAETPSPPPAEAPAPPPAAKDENPEPTVEIDPTEERVSADNNLTFPVDI
jgi:hypothetical protein